ncbi:hypothetical protein NUACC21_01710 [Scytonema sp. NUACC21]
MSDKDFRGLLFAPTTVHPRRPLSIKASTDFRVVDGAVNLTGFFTLVSGEGLKYLENGRAQFYALIVFGAVLGLVIVFGVT